MDAVGRWLPGNGRALRRAAARGLVLGLAGALALGPMTGRAQEEAAEESGGTRIETVGYGEAGVAAESARVQFLVSLTNPYFGGPPTPPRSGEPVGTAEREAAEPVVEALTGEGLAEDAVELVVSPTLTTDFGPGGQAFRLDVALAEIGEEGVGGLVEAVAQAVADNNLFLSRVGVAYEVADCAPVRRAAREAALEDARAQAEAQAEVLGVDAAELRVVATADEPVAAASLTDFYGFTTGGGGCDPAVTAPFGVGGVTAPLFDPTGEAEVEVYVQVRVTFAGPAAE